MGRLTSILMLFGILMVPWLSWSAYTIDVAENQERVVDSEVVVFAGHSTSFWDGNEKTRSATEKLVAHGLESQATIIATMAAHMVKKPELAKLHYLNNQDIDILVASVAGQHNLKFPNLKKIFFVGGNLGRCLCEGIRDVVRGFYRQRNFRSVDMFLIRDGIYDGYPHFSPMKPDYVHDFVHRFFIPGFKCPLQNWEIKPLMKMGNVGLNLFFNGAPIRRFDLNPKTPSRQFSKFINIHFIDSAEIPRYL